MQVINLKTYARSMQPRLYHRYEKITAAELAAELQGAIHENGGHLSGTEQSLILLYMKHLGYNETFHTDTVIMPADDEVIRQADKAADILGVKVLPSTMLLHSEENFLRQEIDRRRIRHCVHFTRANNLETIMRFGLLPRNMLDEQGISYVYNDQQRLDAVSGSISVSLSFPNYRMFYKYRRESKEDWAVLLLDPYYVLSLDCAYCYTNAANAAVRGISIKERKSLASFLGLFYEPEEASREQRDLADHEPTDPQAELLVCEPIPLQAVQAIAFVDGMTADSYRGLLREYGIEAIGDDSYFEPRHDYTFW